MPAAARSAPRRRLQRDDVNRFLDRGRKDRRKVLRFGIISAPPPVAAELGVVIGEEVLHVVRLRTDTAGPLTYTEAFVPKRLAQGISRAALERKAFVQVLEEAGVKISAAEQRVSCEAAPPSVASALDIALHAPVLKLVRVIHEQDGLPVQFFIGWYRADRFEVHMRLSRAEDATRVWVDYH